MRFYFFASIAFVLVVSVTSSILVLSLVKPSSETPQVLEAAVVDESEEEKSVRLLFFGDMMFGRNVEVLTNAYGLDYPFEKIDALIAEWDFVHANLEGPIPETQTPTQTGSVNFSFKEEVAGLLARHGIDAVTLANNHTLDKGTAAYENTKVLLGQAGVLYGGHSTSMAAEYILHTTIEDQPFAFASFNVTFPFNDQGAAIQTVRELAESSSELIIVNVHWGAEYETTSNATQQELAHAFIDAGAHLIIGHHPHVVQEYEEYNDRMIFYSLGNFIFDQYFSDETQQGLAVGVEIAESGSTYTLYPFVSVKSQPELLAGQGESLANLLML